MPSPRSAGAISTSAQYMDFGRAIAAVLGLPALIYLFFPPKVRKAEEWVEVADLAKLPPIFAVGSDRSAAIAWTAGRS